MKDLILEEYQKGNIVVSGVFGPQVMPIENFIEQPVEGMLYDLNRNELVVLQFIDDPKWVNDYAVAKTIRALKEKIEKLEKKLKDGNKNI